MPTSLQPSRPRTCPPPRTRALALYCRLLLRSPYAFRTDDLARRYYRDDTASGALREDLDLLAGLDLQWVV